MITEKDVKNSLSRLQNAFEGQYGDFPIWEDKRCVGMLTLDEEGKKFFITYRGSMNSFFEIFSCLFVWKKPLSEIPGNAHAGLYNAFQKTQISFEKTLERILKENQISINQFSFVVEGYSRGSGLAALTALFLKQQYPSCMVDVLTYSPMKVFDERGAESYKNILQEHHWSFFCSKDFFPKWIGPSCLGFRSIGKKVTFHAKESPNYNKRVSKNTYTYLARIPIISWLIKKLVSSATWEAHMPTIYNELAPLAYSRVMRK
jgi:hypothetical protein